MDAPTPCSPQMAAGSPPFCPPTRVTPTRFDGRCTNNTQCPTGSVCSNGVCTNRPTPTLAPRPTTAGVCGQRCTTDAGCDSGLTCTPIWWPCGSMPANLSAKLQADQPLTADETEEMMSICPMSASVLPAGYVTASTVKMPTFYGVCRKPGCLDSPKCSCTPVPTEIAGNEVKMIGMFVNPTVKVGGEVLGVVRVESANMKVSAVNTQITYDTNYFDFVESVPSEGTNVLKNAVDKTTGKITVYLSWNLPNDRLPISPNVVQFKLRAKKVGTGSMKFDKSYLSEVSGVDDNGKSTGFVIGFSTDPKYQRVEISNATSCAVCTSGLVKSTGNANCDGQVGSVDFEIWRNEMFDLGGLSGKMSSTWKADFDCSQTINGVDFEIWRKTVFQ